MPLLYSVVPFTSVVWVCLVCLLLCKEDGSSPVSAITERRDMGLYEVSLSMSLLGFVLANFHMCSIMLVLRVVFNMLVRNASPRGPMSFRCNCNNCVRGSVIFPKSLTLIYKYYFFKIVWKKWED